MRIGIDARLVGPEGTGLGKYTEKLIANLQIIDKKNHYSIFLKENNWQYLKILNENFQKTLADVSWYSIEEQIKMPSIYEKQKLHLLHIPHFNVPILYKGKFVVTIHDLIHQKFTPAAATTKSKLTFKLKKIGYQKVINHAISKSSKIITPSKFVKDEIVKNFKVNEEKIKVTYEAAEEEYFSNHKPETINQKPFLLYVGNTYPHKNLTKLLDALKLLKSINLKIVCPRDIFWQRLHAEIKKRNLEKRVTLAGYMKSKELAKIFAYAKAYISPSLSEGFGIPGLNAMASKIPVIASDIPTYKEVYKDAAIYFNPKDIQDISEKLNKVLQSQTLQGKLIKKGNILVNKYSWLKLAETTLHIYNNS